MGRAQLPPAGEATPQASLLPGKGRTAAREGHRMSGEGFLGRWSRRKREAASAPAAQPTPPVVASTPAQPQQPAAPSAPPPLPPLESLTPESDFSPFLRPDVDAEVRGRALKTLFGDPALYPMDGLDIYIDDYSKPDPLPPGWLEKLNQFAALDGPQPKEAPPAAAPAPLAAAQAPGSATPEAPGTPSRPGASDDPAPAESPSDPEPARDA